MPEAKVTLIEMAEAVGDAAFSARGRVERWDRERPHDPLAPNHHWLLEARRLETALLTLSLMALDEEASRKVVASIVASKPTEAAMLTAMIAPLPRSTTTRVEAA